MGKILIMLLLLVAFSAEQCPARLLFVGTSEGVDFQVEEVAGGLGVPWGMTFLGPSELLFTEREGKISILHLDSGKRTVLQGGPEVFNEGQGGMLDVAVPKNYSPGDWIYFTYSKREGNMAATTLARAHVAGDQLTDWEDILTTNQPPLPRAILAAELLSTMQVISFLPLGIAAIDLTDRTCQLMPVRFCVCILMGLFRRTTRLLQGEASGNLELWSP